MRAWQGREVGLRKRYLICFLPLGCADRKENESEALRQSCRDTMLTRGWARAVEAGVGPREKRLPNRHLGTLIAFTQQPGLLGEGPRESHSV